MKKNITKLNDDLIKQIRLHINDTNKQNILLQNIPMWRRLCICLDTIEDMSLAVNYYATQKYPEEVGGKYLFVFGLLQCLFVQQDAISGLHLALFGKAIDYKANAPLNQIRNIRNDVVGHPTARGSKDDLKYVGISRFELAADRLTYYIDPSAECESRKTLQTDIAELINNQNQGLNSILKEVKEKLDKEFKDYIKMHKKTKIYDVFNHLGYAREKLLTKRDIAGHFREFHFKTINKTLDDYKKELDKRYVSWRETTSKYYIESIEKLISMIESLPKIDSTETEDLDYALIELIFYKFDELQEIAREIDDFFARDGKEKVYKKGISPKITIKFVSPRKKSIDKKRK